MRKQKLVLILVMLFVTANIFAQRGWYWQNPAPTGHDINCIQNINSNLIVAGGYCSFLKSTNGGNSWIYKDLNLQASCLNIVFKNTLTGYLLRDDNTVSKTTDGGESWTVIWSVPQSSGLISMMKFIDINYGLAIVGGNKLYKTTNGGVNWFLFTTLPSSNSTIRDFYSPSEKIVKCVYYHYVNTFDQYSRIWSTSDYGSSWYDQNISSTFTNCLSIGFCDSLHGFIGGSFQRFFETEDGGATWNAKNLNFGYNFTKIEFMNSQTGYVISNYYLTDTITAHYTTDAGLTWRNLNYIPSNNICFVDSSSVIAGGHWGKLFKSTNLGTNWMNKQTSYFQDTLYRVQCVTDSIFYATGLRGVIVKTTNGGATWVKQLTGANSFFTGIHFINGNTGTAVAPGYIVQTTNGGTNWTIQVSSGNYLTSVYFLNNNIGYVTGWNGVFLRTTNGGINWTQISGVPNQSYQSIYFLNNETGYVSASGPMCKTTNGGVNWFSLPGSPQGYKVYFPDQNTGIVIDDYGVINRTTNGAVSWSTVPSTTTDLLRDITFINENTGYAVGTFYMALIETTDKGASWVSLNPGMDRLIHGLSSINGYAVLVGEGGLIKSTKPGPSVFINTTLNNTVPDKFLLHQNYPNPFNPSTVIRYQLSVAGFTILKVFDLLGKEVASLVNEKQNAGSYAVDFNSTEFNLPSGIYFYTLNAGEFKETRKMVLVK
jgi:photosystem II stability/assembly factor-like uncharacterized protein